LTLSFSNIGIMNDSTIVVAGATGNLGGRIARALLERGASVRALVRHDTARDKLERLQELGVTIASVDLNSTSQVTQACSCAFCMVSALQGLRDVIVETQTVRIFGALNECTVFMAVGTSGVVEPAASFVASVFGRARANYVGPEEPANASLFTECHLGKAGEVLPELLVAQST
jgi:NmrA-like family